MKTLKQLLVELPTKPLIITYGRFNPPTSGHELLIQAVQKLSKKFNIPYRIYATATQDKKKNPLSQKDKIKYMEKSFRDPHIYAAKGNIIQLLQSLEREHFKEIHIVVGSDRVKEFETLLNKYNNKDYKFDKIEIHSAGERDPDADDATGMSASKMRLAASSGKYAEFETGASKNISKADVKRMYNDVRKGLGLQAESFVINIDNKNELREKYFNGEIFNIGTTVQDEKGVYEIMDRGTNYITVINENGELSKKWLDSVKEVITDMKFNETTNENQVSFKGFTTKNFEVIPELKPIIESIVALEKDSIAVINALKSLDESLGLYKQNKDLFKIPLLKGVDALKNIDHAISGIVSDMILKLPREKTEITEANTMNFTGADKIKVARILAGALGVDAPEKMSNPEQLVNMGLRLIRTKRITPELSKVITSMLDTANMLGIKYDKALIPSTMKKDDKETVKEDATERLASMKSRMSDLVSKLGAINPADKDAKTKMAIIKSDIATLRLRINDLSSKKEAIDVLDPAGLASTIEDPLSPAVMPSFVKFGESLEESNKYTVKSIVKDPAATAGGEKNEPKEKSRVVIATSPEEAKKKVAADLKKSGWSINSQTVIKTEKLSEEEKKGLWANIRARREKGLRRLRPGEKGYPKTLDIESKENIEEKDKDDPCWVGYKQVGMKKKNGKEVPNCVPEETIKESHYKVGDKVIYKDKEAEVVKVDQPETGDYYTVKTVNGEVKASPNDLKSIKETKTYRKIYGEEKANKTVESILGMVKRLKEKK